MRMQPSSWIAPLLLGASCAGPAPAPQAPAHPETPAAATAKTPAVPRASGKPEIRYYEIADA
jgi:hypothetical protein